MEPPLFAKYLPLIWRLLTSLDVNTEHISLFVVSFRLLSVLLFSFSTLTCLYSNPNQQSEEKLQKYHDFLGIYIYFFTEICLFLRKHEMCQLIKYLGQPLELGESNTVQSQIVNDYNRKISMFGKAAIVGIVIVCPTYSLSPFILYLFESEEPELNRCINLAFGWVYPSISRWYMYAVHIASASIICMDALVVFILNMIIAFAVVKIAFTIKLLCADLCDMNVLLNWTEESLNSDNSGGNKGGMICTDPGTSTVQMSPAGGKEVIGKENGGNMVVILASDPGTSIDRLNRARKKGENKRGYYNSYVARSALALCDVKTKPGNTRGVTKLENELGIVIHTGTVPNIAQSIGKGKEETTPVEKSLTNFDFHKSGRECIRNKLIQSYLKKIVDRHVKIIQ